jgi:hypothetical protein
MIIAGAARTLADSIKTTRRRIAITSSFFVGVFTMLNRAPIEKLKAVL